MNSNFLKLNLKDVAGAITSGVIMALLGYLSNVTDIFLVDWRELVNLVVLAIVTSLLKSLATNKDGDLLGVIKVK